MMYSNTTIHLETKLMHVLCAVDKSGDLNRFEMYELTDVQPDELLLQRVHGPIQLLDLNFKFCFCLGASACWRVNLLTVVTTVS